MYRRGNCDNLKRGGMGKRERRKRMEMEEKKARCHV